MKRKDYKKNIARTNNNMYKIEACIILCLNIYGNLKIINMIIIKVRDAILRFFRCSILSIVRTIEHDGVEHAGYMSFMVLFSLFPFLVFFLVLTSLLGASELGENFMELLIQASLTQQPLLLRIVL
jgi:hypothetical protein